MNGIKLSVVVVFVFALLTPSVSLAEGTIELVDQVGDPGQVTCIAQGDSSLWVGTRGAGVYELRRTDAGLDVRAAFDARSGLPGNQVHDCVASEGVLWVATDSGLARLEEGKGVQRVRSGRFVRVARHGQSVWAVSEAKLLWNWTGQRWRSFPLDGLATSLALSVNGEVALGRMDGTVQRGTLDSGRMTWRTERVLEPVQRLLFVEEGLWIQAVGAHYRWDAMARPARQIVRHHAWPLSDGRSLDFESLKRREVFAAIDWMGLEVVATDTGLVFRHDSGDQWSKVDLSGMPCGARIAALATFNGNLWVGSFDRGLCRKTKNGWVRYFGSKYLASDMVHDMSADDDYLYVATHDGLTRMNKQGRFEVLTVAQCKDKTSRQCPWHATVNGVAYDSVTGRAWMSDVGAVHKMSPKRWRRFYHQAGVRSTRLTRIDAHNGRVAVGTGDQGILLMEDGKNFVSITDQDGLADNWVMDLHFGNNGDLWVATCTKGLSRYRNGSWRTFTRKDGLLDDYVLSVKTIENKVWVGTLSGLSVMGPDGVQSFAPEGGLSGREVHDIVSFGGRVYVATDGGLSIFRDRTASKNKTPKG